MIAKMIIMMVMIINKAEVFGGGGVSNQHHRLGADPVAPGRL